MDFSSPVLVDFALNFAGYALVALLVGVIVRPAARREKVPETHAAGSESLPQKAGPQAEPRRADSRRDVEFIPLGSATQHEQAAKAVNPTPEGGTVSRAEHRRAIYAEARRLLAKGGSRSDVLNRLPLTENEIDALVTTGTA